MCTQDLCFEQKKKRKYHLFHLKIIIFTAFKNLCIMHGHVCLMYIHVVSKASSFYISENSGLPSLFSLERRLTVLMGQKS